MEIERVRHGDNVKRLSFLSSFLDFLCHVRNKLIYVLSRWTVSVLTQVLFWYLFPSLLCNSGNKHQITLSWMLKQFVTGVHTLLYIHIYASYICTTIYNVIDTWINNVWYGIGYQLLNRNTLGFDTYVRMSSCVVSIIYFRLTTCLLYVGPPLEF